MNMNKDPKLYEIENNQRKIIEQNKKIISLLEKINANLINISHKPIR